MNRITLVGNIGRDGELKHLGQNGTPLLQFSMATKPNWKGQKSQEKPVNWHVVKVWGKLAEIVSPGIRKGSKVFVEGELEIRQYKGKDGSDKKAYEVIADEVYVLESQTRSQGGSSGAEQSYIDPVDPGFTEDTIPF